MEGWEEAQEEKGRGINEKMFEGGRRKKGVPKY